MAIKKQEVGPDTPTGDYIAMQPYWQKAQTMLDGVEAMRLAGKRYLPAFPKERKDHYEFRRANAKFTNVFRDIVENLASKPFAKLCKLNDEKASEQLLDLAQDIDAAGNNLHVFAENLMFNGIAKAIDYILVDYTALPDNLTVAEEKSMNARPYWVRYAAESVIEARTEMIDGKEQFVRVRLLEPSVEQDGEWGEKTVERVRVFWRPLIAEVGAKKGAPKRYGSPRWQLHEKTVIENRIVWKVIGEGTLRIPMIPLVPYVVGRRKAASWRFDPPMKDAADVQEKHYQQETNLENVKDRMCFPVLVGMGVPRKDEQGKEVEIPYGPSTVLFAPVLGEGKHGDWKLLEPSAESMKFLASDLDATERRLRELGRQPLTAQSGNLTVVTTAVAAQKANSAVQAWAWNLKDALEQAFRFTCMWLNDDVSEPDVFVHTDFGIELADGTSMDRIIKMRQARDLDRQTLWTEAQRRGDLSTDFNPEEAEKRLREEEPDPDEIEEVEASVTPPLRRAA